MVKNSPFILTGDLGKDVYQEYCRAVDTKFERNGELFHQFPNGFNRYDMMVDECGTVEGCGSFSMCLMDEVLQKRGLRVLDLSDYHSLPDMDPAACETLSGMHFNFGLVLVGDKRFDFHRESRYENGTKKLKEDLKKQIIKRKYSLSSPVYIPFSSLELELDESSEFGLRFRLLDDAILQSSESLRGKDTTKVLKKAVLHATKARRQGLYDFKFYANVCCIAPASIDDILKPHHCMGPEGFEKMSHSYGRVLVVPLTKQNYGTNDIFMVLPNEK